MTIQWSPHAQGLLADILCGIALNLYPEDAFRWQDKIDACVMQLEDFPFSGADIPHVCFETVPANAEQLRQILCRPYRIVYEVIDSEVHILSIRHARMLVIETDTFWN